MPMPAGIQIGARTHTQGHVITLQSLRTMKTIPRMEKKGKVTFTVLLLLFMLLPFLVYKCFPSLLDYIIAEVLRFVKLRFCVKERKIIADTFEREITTISVKAQFTFTAFRAVTNCFHQKIVQFFHLIFSLTFYIYYSINFRNVKLKICKVYYPGIEIKIELTGERLCVLPFFPRFPEHSPVIAIFHRVADIAYAIFIIGAIPTIRGAKNWFGIASMRIKMLTVRFLNKILLAHN